MPELKFTILGCGSSGGVPRIGGHWGDCDPGNERNRRTRCSMLIELSDGAEVTRVLVDTSPDLRQQLLRTGVGRLDGVVFTHSHADHVNGLDDLRAVFHNCGKRIPVWADTETQDQLIKRFGYAFAQPPGSPYPPILELQSIDGPVSVPGPAGSIELVPFPVEHGTVKSKGFRIAKLAYLPDVSEIDPNSWQHLEDLDYWILDALRRSPHPSHVHLSQSLAWIRRVAPRRAVLTNMHIDLDYETLLSETPPNVEPAYDGMTITCEI